MYERVMVPLDGTPFGESALPVALDIATRSGAAIDLVHVHVHVPDEDLEAFTPYQYQHVTRRYQEWDARAFDREEEELLDMVSTLAADTGLSVAGHVLSGEVAEALRDEANRFDADLIIMATHARTGLDRARKGSVADLVMRHAPAPVLLLQPVERGRDAPAPTVRRILVPLDGSATSNSMLETAAGFAGLYDAELRLIHIMDRDSGAGAALFDGIDDDGVETIDARGVTPGILDVAEGWNADLIALATHGRGGLSRLIVGSTASELLARSHLPMLLRRPGMRPGRARTPDAGVQRNGV